MNNHTETLSPILYLPHGGGPLPLLGDVGHGELVSFLQSVPNKLGQPRAILMISAHWEEETWTIGSGFAPELIYDYQGFPEQSYHLEYSAPGSPELATVVADLLGNKGISCVFNENRGFDHGMFVPMTIMYPEADIPCIQLSLLRSLDPQAHIDIGKALSELRKDNVLIIGSGMSYHNMSGFSDQSEEIRKQNTDFEYWLIDVCTSGLYEAEEREQMLSQWEQAPSARECHPREEHLLPLHVCMGAALGQGAEVAFNNEVIGRKVSAYIWK